MNASLRLPITRIPPSDDMSPSEKLSLTERFRSPEDHVGAQSLAQLEKPKDIKKQQQLNGSGLQQSQLRHLQLFCPWNVP